MPIPAPRLVRAARAALAALALLAVADGALSAFGVGGAPAGRALHVVAVAGVALATLARAALVRAERAAWAALGAGMAVWAVGDALHAVRTDGTAAGTLADALYVGVYPGAFAALALLARSRVRIAATVVWLDGLVVALALTAVAALAGDRLVAATGTPADAVALDLAAVNADLLLAATIAGLVSIADRRLPRSALLLMAGFVLLAAVDAVYAYERAQGGVAVDAALNAGWPLAMLLLAAAAWEPVPRRRLVVSEQRHRIAIPLACGALSVIVLLSGHNGLGVVPHPHAVSLWAAAAALGVLLVRLGLTVAHVRGLLAERERQALTDAVTGLRNRRALLADLRGALEAPGRDHDLVLAILDLDGFKPYNDAFGHPAGDLLLARLGHRLAELAEAHGAAAYRMGGDEFCVLGAVAPGAGADALLAAAQAALSDQGEGFAISASCGHAVLGPEARDPEQALRLADARMYAHKGARRPSAQREARDALHAVAVARDQRLARHALSVAAMAERVARQLELPEPVVREVRDAAALHDVGKLAIPDAIVHRRGPLTDAEWRLMRWHPAIGARIVQAAPSLAPLALAIRHHHERWDGRGYPDGLAGDAIPLPAQIVFVCDAFDAMTSDRPYRRALAPHAALAELQAGAGTQFSPRVVQAFIASWDGGAPAGDVDAAGAAATRPTVAG